jgi:hypothetical protein
LFFDFEEDGALFVMLSTLLIGATVRELSPLEKIFDNSPATLLPILHDIDKNLSLYGFTTSRRIFLNSVPVGLINKLSKIVIEHGGELVTAEEQATHVIDWYEDIDNNNESNSFYVDEQNARAIDVRALNENGEGLYYLIHWPFLPDSANEWVLESAVTLSLIEQQAAVQGCKDKSRNYVACRYLLDVDNYNEWGHDADYEVGTVPVNSSSVPTDGVDEDTTVDAFSANATSAPTGTRKAPKGGRGRRSSSSNASIAAQAAQKKDKELPLPALATSLYEKLFSDILPETLTRSIFQGAAQTARVLEVDFSGSRISSASATTTTKAAAIPSSTASVKDEATADEVSTTGNKRKIDDISSSSSSSVGSAKCPAVWLSIDKISEFERRILSAAIHEHLPQGVSSYLQLRNAMVQLYLQRPQQYLSATDCRRKMAGDVARVTRIHEFLDAFGAINYAVKPEARPTSSVPVPLAAEYKRDFALSQRRQLLVDRLAQRYPSCAVLDTSTYPTASAVSNSAAVTNTSVSTNINTPGTSSTASSSSASTSGSTATLGAATHNWTQVMDSQLLRVVRSTAMDWAAISREMARWFEAEYMDTLESSTTGGDASAAGSGGGIVVKDENVSNSPPIKQESDQIPQENNNTNNPSNGTSSKAEDSETARQRLKRMSATQRQALVTPLLCMLRFMELQMSAVIRSAAGPSIDASSSTSAASAAAGFAPGVESGSGNGRDSQSRAVSMFTHPALLTQHPSVLAATIAASGAGKGAADVGSSVSSSTTVVSRVTQAVTHLIALDHLLQHTSTSSSSKLPSEPRSTTDTSNSDGNDMDVDDDGPTPSDINPGSAISQAIGSLTSQMIAQLTSETSDFIAHLQDRQELLLRTALDARVASLETKLSLVEEVERVLQSERDQLEIDKREFFLQKLLHVTTTQGVALQVPNAFHPSTAAVAGGGGGGMTANSTMLGSSYGSSNNMFSGGSGGGGGGGLSTSASSTALASMMMM